MPTKKRLPTPNITIRRIDTFNPIRQWVHKYRIQTIQIPSLGLLIHQCVQYICSIQWRAEGYVLPKLCVMFNMYHGLDLLDTLVLGYLVELKRLCSVLAEGYWLFWDVQAFVYAAFAEGVLLDWAVHD